MVLVEFGTNPRLPRKRTNLTPEERVARLTAQLEVAKAALDNKKASMYLPLV
jgi:hypothetical protein